MKRPSPDERFFLDTNILIYTFDRTALRKSKRALELVRVALSTGIGFVSYQVIQEFTDVSTRKFAAPLSSADCAQYLDAVLAPLCEVFPSIALYHDALDIGDRWQLSYYDALVVAAALSQECQVLYTEDLQHGQKIRSLRIENPFL